MVGRNKVKITVLRRFHPSEVFKTSPVTPVEPLEACEVFRDDQVFVVDTNGRMPQGFCTTTWNTLFCDIRTLAFGGNLPYYKEKGIAIRCCPDGLRPVVFKLERI